MKAQHAGKLIAEPRIITQSGRPATFLSGGQQPCLTGMKMVEHPDGSQGPEFETQMMPFGINMKFLPVVDRDGLFMQCDCELGAPARCTGSRLSLTAGNLSTKPS